MCVANKIVPDTSVIVDGRITKLVRTGELRGAHILVPMAALAELEHLANRAIETGHSGLEELRVLRMLSDEGLIKLEYVGQYPTPEQIDRIDTIIRDLAKSYDAELLTSDYVQAKVANALAIKVRYLEPEKDSGPLSIEKYFGDDTMSVHLKDRVVPYAKQGMPGRTRFVKLSDTPLKLHELRMMAREIVERAKRSPDGFIEIERKGATVVQLGPYRIAITHPPFSDGLEITAVKSVATVDLEHYNLPKKVYDRINERAEGILIAGPPGAGKSTFAQALAEYYRKLGKIVKTMESPRDLQVSDEITQYSPLEGDMEKTSDILLLVRPDYTIYDEMRRSKDFQIFADMRLAGVGMIGVVHATRAIDAIQRLIGRVELGVIPQIVDTVIYVRNARVEEIYEMRFTVKVPMGMTEEDLARPVITVSDFIGGEVKYEIYTFGEQVVVMPVDNSGLSWQDPEAEERVREVLQTYSVHPRSVEVRGRRAVVRVDPGDVPRLIGRGGRTISNIESELGLKIDVKPTKPVGGEVKPLRVRTTKRSVIIEFDKHMAGKEVKIVVDGEPLFRAVVNRRSRIRVDKNLGVAQKILDGYSRGVLEARTH